MVVESHLHFLIAKDIAGHTADIAAIVLRMIQINPFLEELDYLPLVRACQKQGLITPKEMGKLLSINNYRRCFAHPNGHKDEIKKYQAPEKYLSVLKELTHALMTIAIIGERQRRRDDKQKNR